MACEFSDYKYPIGPIIAKTPNGDITFGSDNNLYIVTTGIPELDAFMGIGNKVMTDPIPGVIHEKTIRKVSVKYRLINGYISISVESTFKCEDTLIPINTQTMERLLEFNDDLENKFIGKYEYEDKGIYFKFNGFGRDKLKLINIFRDLGSMAFSAEYNIIDLLGCDYQYIIDALMKRANKVQVATLLDGKRFETMIRAWNDIDSIFHLNIGNITYCFTDYNIACRSICGYIYSNDIPNAPIVNHSTAKRAN